MEQQINTMKNVDIYYENDPKIPALASQPRIYAYSFHYYICTITSTLTGNNTKTEKYILNSIFNNFIIYHTIKHMEYLLSSNIHFLLKMNILKKNRRLVQR